MKSFPRRHLLIALTLLFVGVTVLRDTSAEDALRYKFSVGKKLSYKMAQEMEMTVTPEGVPNAMKTGTNQTTEMIWNVVEVKEDGSAVIDQSMNRIQMKVTGPGGGFDFDSNSDEALEGPIASVVAPLLNTLAGATFRVTMSPRGDITGVQVPEEVTAAMAKSPSAAQMGEMFTKDGFKQLVQQSSVVFPEDPLTPGVEWTRSVAMDNPATGGKQTIKSKYRYDGKEEVEGKSLEKFTITVELNFGDGPGGAKITIEKQNSQGTIYFDRAAGQMHSASVEMDMDMGFAIGNRNAKMHLDQTVTTKVESVSN